MKNLNNVEKELTLGTIKYFDQAAKNPYGNLSAKDIAYCLSKVAKEKNRLLAQLAAKAQELGMGY